MTLTLEEQFLEIKNMELEIKEKRYRLEQEIADVNGYNVLSGKSFKKIKEAYEIHFSASQVKKVDFQKLKEIKEKHKIPQDKIEEVFRFKAEVNSTEFKKLSLKKQEILNSAVTVQVNKPTLKITKIEIKE